MYMRLLLAPLLLLLLLSNFPLSTSFQNQNESSGIALISSDYIDSKILFITSADGKIYAYDMEKHALKWLADTSTLLQKFMHNTELRFEEQDFVLLPSRDGKVQFFSAREGFEKYEKSELQEGIQNCFSPGKIKYFSKVQEKVLLIDLNKGNFWDMEDGLMYLDPNRMEHFGVLRIKLYKYTAVDFQNMKEEWSLQTSELNFYTYYQFLNNGNMKNAEKMIQGYKIVCKSGNVIEISKSNDRNFLRSIETEEEVVGVHSLDPKAGFFNLKVEIVEELGPKNIFTTFLQKAKIRPQIPCRQNNSQGLVVYHEQHEGYSEDYCTPIEDLEEPIGNQMVIVTSMPMESPLGCIKSYINKRRAIELLSFELSNNKNQQDIRNYQELVNPENELTEKDLIMIGAIIVGMTIAAIMGVSFERRKKTGTKKTVSTEIDGNINETSSASGSMKDASTSSSKESQNKPKEVPVKPKEKKAKKREFEIFSKEMLGMGSQGTVVFQGEFQGKGVAVKRFLKCYTDLARSEISVLMHAEHSNIIRYYLYEEDQYYFCLTERLLMWNREFIYLILERCMCSVRNFVDYFRRGEKSNELDSVPSGKGTVNYRDAIRRVYKEKQITPEFTRQVLLECAKGLQYLHKNGIVHRDIKPENILISYTLEAKLADFGISRTLQKEEVSFLTEAGSFGWKAPEMLRKLDLKSKAVDVFSLGCTFYYFYSKGSHPFGEMHERETNILANRYKMDFLEDFDLEHLIKNMINSNPAERYTIEDVLNHPYFWDEAKKLAFIQELSDFVESVDPAIGRNLEEYCQVKQAISVPWAKSLDKVLVKELTSFRFYDFKSVKELLRVIRNKKNHYYELSEDAQLVLGRMPVGVWNYFNSKFPRLFIHAYIFCKENYVELSVLS